MSEAGGHYEFSGEQNAILAKTATWSRLLAWILIGSSVLMAIAAALSGEGGAMGALVAAAIYFVIGLSLKDAALSMTAVVETAGNDIEHLMTALDKLGSAFKTMAIVFLIGVIISVVVTVAVWAWMSSLPS